MSRTPPVLILVGVLAQACDGEGGGSGGASGAGSLSCDMAQAEECPACSDPKTCDTATYTDNDDGTVASSCCGLEWQQSSAPGQYTWAEAQSYCAGLELAGQGWRLPTRAELGSLVDERVTMPAIDHELFLDTPPQTYWTSSRYCCAPDSAWVVVFNYGLSTSTAVAGTALVRCVRATMP